MPRQGAEQGRMSRLWQLDWRFGSADVQALGGMLGPLRFRLAGGRELDALHVAPWAGEARSGSLPGILRRMRGEWPCVPFGRADYPDDLPGGWAPRQRERTWSHGYAAHHPWQCLEAGPLRVRLALDYPPGSDIARVERTIEADPHSPTLDITLTVHARRRARLPLGLHPTFRLPAAPGRVQLITGPHAGVFSYPVAAGSVASRLLPDTRSDALSRMLGRSGALDLSRLPLAGAAEELVQIRGLRRGPGQPPLALHYLDEEVCVGLWWDNAALPDLMLWISNGGRSEFPWLDRHFALGAEPVNSLFDLGRVARAPPGHPLADRLGVMLAPHEPWRTHYCITAWPATVPFS
ncbi:hypothetical protein RCH08_003811 [Janthinobacterium sp. CG_S6]|nr:hypothetical protein [Janthinobacterium sp. CG_S6]